MKRWNVVLPEYTLELYYQDLETAKIRNPNAINITESSSYAYLEYVEKIKAAAMDITFDYKGRKLCKIPYNSAYIFVRLWLSTEDGEEYYYDGCDYQRHDGPTYPIMWNSSTPEEFFKLFLSENQHEQLPIEIISMRELKKLAPIKFYNKKGIVYYKDHSGYFYVVDKTSLPDKKDHEEYEKFNGSKDAVQAKIYKNDYSYEIQWFSSEDDLVKEFEAIRKNTHSSYTQPFYVIVKRGYTKAAPLDRKIVCRLPYFKLNDEIEYERQEQLNKKSVSNSVAYKWCRMMEGYTQFGDAFSNMFWVEDLIAKWCAYNITKVIGAGDPLETIKPKSMKPKRTPKEEIVCHPSLFDQII